MKWLLEVFTKAQYLECAALQVQKLMWARGM